VLTGAGDGEKAVDPSICPLCGRPNDCGMAAGKSDCWCRYVTIPHEVLDRIPPEKSGKACVCRACATGVSDSESGCVDVDSLSKADERCCR